MHDSAKQSSWVVYSNLLLRDVLSDCITGKGLFSSADCYVMALHLQQGHHTRPSVKCKWLTLPEGYATLRDRSCQGSVCSIPRCSMTVAVAAVNSVVLRRLKTSPTVAAVHMPGQMQYLCAGCCKSKDTSWSFQQQYAANSDGNTNNDVQISRLAANQVTYRMCTNIQVHCMCIHLRKL